MTSRTSLRDASRNPAPFEATPSRSARLVAYRGASRPEPEPLPNRCPNARSGGHGGKRDQRVRSVRFAGTSSIPGHWTTHLTRARKQSGGLEVPSSNLGAPLNGKPRPGGVFAVLAGIPRLLGWARSGHERIERDRARSIASGGGRRKMMPHNRRIHSWQSSCCGPIGHRTKDVPLPRAHSRSIRRCLRQARLIVIYSAGEESP